MSRLLTLYGKGFVARHYIAWTAFKLGVFVGCLIGFVVMAAMMTVPAAFGLAGGL